MAIWDIFSNLGNAASGAGQSISQGLGGLFGGGSGSQSVQGGQGGGLGSWLGNMMGNTAGGKNNVNPTAMLGGLGAMGLGQMFGQAPKMPSFQTPAVQNMQNYKFGSMQNLSPEATQAIEYSLAPQEEQMRRQLRNTYASAMPGTDMTNNTNYKRDVGYTEQNISQNRNAAYQNAIQRLDQQNYQQLTDAANLSVAEISAKYGVSYAEAQQIKQMGGQIGSMMFMKGMYPSGMGMMNPMSMFSAGK